MKIFVNFFGSRRVIQFKIDWGEFIIKFYGKKKMCWFAAAALIFTYIVCDIILRNPRALKIPHFVFILFALPNVCVNDPAYLFNSSPPNGNQFTESDFDRNLNLIFHFFFLLSINIVELVCVAISTSSTFSTPICACVFGIVSIQQQNVYTALVRCIFLWMQNAITAKWLILCAVFFFFFFIYFAIINHRLI